MKKEQPDKKLKVLNDSNSPKGWIKYLTFIFIISLTNTYAKFDRHRIYVERSKFSLNYDWKFKQGDQPGAQGSSYSDASWSKVNIPHSASYDAPTDAGEKAHFRGDSWYRKTFITPQTKHSGKRFLYFEGAMQSADVWLNGVSLGNHSNSGYTSFYFDVTSLLNQNGNNVLAVKLNNEYSADIPPGRGGGGSGKWTDFLHYSGLYRDVWLISVNKVHAPLHGQSITFSEVSSANATVQVSTKVMNTGSTAANVSVEYILTDSTNTVLQNFSVAKTLAPGVTESFFQKSSPLTNPKLWSTDSPYLYRVYTKIKVDGITVDDLAERIGIRTLTWPKDDWLHVNGVRTQIRGVNLHQSFAWIQNAMPTSRFYEEIKLVKNMGANLIRTAHFPRDPEFYDAADELGIMIQTEVPTWGYGQEFYSDIFWTRLNECLKNMIEVGKNNSSIVMWGFFNEAHAEFPGRFETMQSIAKSLDTTRFTTMASLNPWRDHSKIVDVLGLNYALSGNNPRVFNSEFHQGWESHAKRGSTGEDEWTTRRWDRHWVQEILGAPKVGGGVMWSFNDYFSFHVTDRYMGVVDHYRIPKKAFYVFRKNWANIPADDPIVGLVPSKIDLQADLKTLVADSTDISKIEVNLRDPNGKVASVARPVTFSITGPAVAFGSLTTTTVVGKIALVIRSTNVPGTITVTAKIAGLPDETVTLQSVAPNLSSISSPLTTPLYQTTSKFAKPILTSKGKKFEIQWVGSSQDIKKISLTKINGEKFSPQYTLGSHSFTIDAGKTTPGVYFLQLVTTKNTYTYKTYIK